MQSAALAPDHGRLRRRKVCCDVGKLRKPARPGIVLYLSLAAGRLSPKAGLGWPRTVARLIIQATITHGLRSHWPVMHHFRLPVPAACGSTLFCQLSVAKILWPARTLTVQTQRSVFNENDDTYLSYFPRNFRAQTASYTTAASAAVPDAPTAEVLADTVLIVESKTKANKIQKYLGPSYKVLTQTFPAELSTSCSRHLCQTRHILGPCKGLLLASRF